MKELCQVQLYIIGKIRIDDDLGLAQISEYLGSLRGLVVV